MKKLNFFIHHLSISFFLLILIPFSTLSHLSAVDMSTDDGVRITFAGNSGFIIESNRKKIAIDSFFKGFPGRYTLPEKVIRKMKNSMSPFDNIDLILSTHLHADHLKIGYVSGYMAKNKKTEFISTLETQNIMSKRLPEFVLFSERVHGINPGWGETQNIVVNGINITIFGMPHGNNPVQHICFIFRAGEKKILHLGDLSGDRVSRVFGSAEVDKKKFDIAFIPYWYLTGQKNANTIKKNINTKQIIAMHLSLTDSNNDISELASRIRTYFPHAIIFTRELQTKIL